MHTLFKGMFQHKYVHFYQTQPTNKRHELTVLLNLASQPNIYRLIQPKEHIYIYIYISEELCRRYIQAIKD